MLFFKYNAKRKKKERNAQGLYEETLWGLGRIRTGEPRLREQGSAASSCRSSQVRLQSQYSIGCVRGEVGATQGITSNEKTLQRKNQEERLTCLDATTFYKAELAWRWEEHVSVLGRPGVLCTRRPGAPCGFCLCPGVPARGRCPWFQRGHLWLLVPRGASEQGALTLLLTHASSPV